MVYSPAPSLSAAVAAGNYALPAHMCAIRLKTRTPPSPCAPHHHHYTLCVWLAVMYVCVLRIQCVVVVDCGAYVEGSGGQ